MSTDHGEARELLAVVALDAVEGEERHRVERHVEVCDECRDELDGHRTIASLLAAQAATPHVPDSLWTSVVREISAPVVVPLRRGTPFLAAIGAAAALLALVVVQTARLETVQSDLLAAQSKLAEVEGAITAGDWSRAALVAASTPGARSVDLSGDGAATIVLLPDGTGFVTGSELATPDTGRTYQLWIVQRGEAVSAGLLRDGAVGSTFRFDPATLEGLVVTEEPSAGVVVSDGPAVAAWFDT